MPYGASPLAEMESDAEDVSLGTESETSGPNFETKSSSEHFSVGGLSKMTFLSLPYQSSAALSHALYCGSRSGLSGMGPRGSLRST